MSETAHDAQSIVATPASTIILLREATNGIWVGGVPVSPPELLVVERGGALSFAGGATVFPGGKVDPDDHRLARDCAYASLIDDPEDAAARVAAIRECLEEVGLAVGFSTEAARLADMRAALRANMPFSALLASHGLSLDLSALAPFARWRPKANVRHFDTRFYLAAAPDGQVDADGIESVHAHWLSARAVLDSADAGERQIIFPTRRNLERLARWTSIADVYADAAAFPVRTVTSYIETRDDGDHLCIPDGHGYPVLSEPLASARRA